MPAPEPWKTTKAQSPASLPMYTKRQVLPMSKRPLGRLHALARPAAARPRADPQPLPAAVASQVHARYLSVGRRVLRGRAVQKLAGAAPPPPPRRSLLCQSERIVGGEMRDYQLAALDWMADGLERHGPSPSK